MFLISDLCTMLESYLDKEQVAEIYQAYLFGAEAHQGQTRISGEPYIYHPIAVARILAELHFDHTSIIAAILHDVIEDTPIAKKQVANLFGQEVANLVDGVTKLDHLQFESKDIAKAESFRKMILAMVKDLRIILIKLADRLHNMRTLKVVKPDKARRIARETLEIYAPIANRLGMNKIRYELESLGFKAYYPWRSRVLEQTIQTARGNRKTIINKLQASLSERLQQEGLSAEVLGREKHSYSIYNKMVKKHITFNKVTDIYGFRIIINSVDNCYRALGIIHNWRKPVPGKFKDYIAIPKANGYQSLHTVLSSNYNFSIEVQIRTHDMHNLAEYGVAAHWAYKSEAKASNSQHHARARQWLQNLLEIQQNTCDSMEFLENVKLDLFPDEVYVFTPQGEIIELPRGATIVDFAYRVHSDIGNTCIRAKIDQQVVPLNTTLHNGQTVEIITASGAQPNLAWLTFVTTSKARSSIRNYMKNMQRSESIALGHRLLNQCLSDQGLTLETLSQQRINTLLKDYQLPDMDTLLEEIGFGQRIAQLVIKRLLPQISEDEKSIANLSPTTAHTPLAIKGTEGLVITYAKCCHPVPGDDIVGFISAGRGIVIHTCNCKNTQEYQKKPEKWVHVQWSDEVQSEFSVAIRVITQNQRGALAKISSEIAKIEANIEHVDAFEHDENYYAINFIISTRNRQHLAQILKAVHALPIVTHVSRVKQ